jgi:hypothetical protein
VTTCLIETEPALPDKVQELDVALVTATARVAQAASAVVDLAAVDVVVALFAASDLPQDRIAPG